MRIAICKENQKEQEWLKEAINNWSEARIIQTDVNCFTSAEDFLVVWPDTSFDLVFLDIKLNGMNGIQLAEYIRYTDENILLVFVTNITQYAFKGYDVAALHYLTKPLSSAKFQLVLDKAYAIWRSRRKGFFVVPDDSKQIKLPIDSISYISMLCHTAEIHTDNKTYKMRKTAAELSDILPSYFIRCHRSFIINLLKTDGFCKDSIFISGGTKLPISRNNLKQVKDAFLQIFAE